MNGSQQTVRISDSLPAAIPTSTSRMIDRAYKRWLERRGLESTDVISGQASLHFRSQKKKGRK